VGARLVWGSVRRPRTLEENTMSLQLLVIAGPDQGRAFTLDAGPNLMLGRSSHALYRLNDLRVSRNHCQILLEGDAVTVVDNGGSGGTLINGTAVNRHLLKPGDVLQVGDSQLRLQLGDFPVDVVTAAATTVTTPAFPAAPATPEHLGALTGQTLAHYAIGPVLGNGQSGLVFQATDTKDGRAVALKVLQPDFARDEEEVQRFIRAMKTMLPLRHPNLVTLYAAGKTGTWCWVAMELVEGEPLTRTIQRIGVAGMLDWRNAFRVAVHVGRALEYAQAEQIIHRNVTPHNVLLQTADKVVKLGDLMLAKALEGALARQITRQGAILGDVAYMSPERTRGVEEVDGRSDLYGLGATVYALLTGRPPCEGNSLVEQVARIRQTEPVKPTRFQLAIPHPFEMAVLKLLAKKPEDRYQTATDLLKDLNRIGKAQNVNV
jgi:serine/threonine protein kinase